MSSHVKLNKKFRYLLAVGRYKLLMSEIQKVNATMAVGQRDQFQAKIRRLQSFLMTFKISIILPVLNDII